MDQENSLSKSSSYQRKSCYRDLLSRIEGLQENEDVGINAVNELGQIFKDVNSINDQCEFSERVEFAEETLLESVVLSSASGVLVKCIENVDIFQSTYDPAEFASKLLNSIKQDWLTLVEDVRSIVPELPSYHFLYGSFDPTKTPIPKHRKEIKRDAQEQVPKKKLHVVQSVEKDEEGIDETVNFLSKVLNEEYAKNGHQPISYYDFVIDSKSFSATVENIFYSSFLVRDGKAQLNIDRNNIATLKPMHKRDLNAFRTDGGINSQMIVSLCMDDWEDLRRKSGFIQLHKKQKLKQ